MDDLRASIFIPKYGISGSIKEMGFIWIWGIGSIREWILLREWETWKEGKVRLGDMEIRCTIFWCLCSINDYSKWCFEKWSGHVFTNLIGTWKKLYHRTDVCSFHPFDGLLTNIWSMIKVYHVPIMVNTCVAYVCVTYGHRSVPSITVHWVSLCIGTEPPAKVAAARGLCSLLSLTGAIQASLLPRNSYGEIPLLIFQNIHIYAFQQLHSRISRA